MYITSSEFININEILSNIAFSSLWVSAHKTLAVNKMLFVFGVVSPYPKSSRVGQILIHAFYLYLIIMASGCFFNSP